MVLNAVGRDIPEEVEGRKLKPYAGQLSPPSIKAAERIVKFREPGDKIVTLEDAIRNSGLEDGMTISFHHCLRNGDRVMNLVVDKLAEMGFKDIGLAQTAMFKAHEKLIGHIESGVITRIEGSINGPVGKVISQGKLPHPVVLRSHGGRPRAMEAGELRVDVAFIAASCSDGQGNCNGVLGKSAFGPMGFAFADAWFADKVVVVTDNLVPYPASPISIQECYVDYVVEVESIGDVEGIMSGTTKVTEDPERLRIARHVVELMELFGLIENGMSFQAGAGGISLAVVKFLHERMKEKGVTANFAVGGATQLVVDMLHDGTLKTIIDAQAFDKGAIESLREDRGHMEVSHYHLMNPHNRGCVVHNQGACFLGATEIDVDFNVNVNTYSGGVLAHGTGGHQDAANGSKVTFIVAPVARKKFPIVRDRVTTVSTPGNDIDVVVTDKGIAINPRREDLLEKVKGSDLPIVPIEKLRDTAYEITGGAPPEPEYSDKIAAIVEYRDGTVLDIVRCLKNK